jgi:prepilin signal peptidase PulO-like enzyme (type II secretory pathway)
MTIIFLILGLIIGSFINAVVYRLYSVESLMERSHCPHCRKQVRWFDNIPLVSFLVLSAKCRDCGEKISWQYPMVEFISGIMFAMIGTYFFNIDLVSTWLLTTYYLMVFSLLLIIFVYDLKYMEIPMIILWAGVIFSAAYFVFVDWQSFSLATNYLDLRLVSGLLAGGVAFAFFFGLSWFSKETWMGYGDAYLGLLIGMIVGWPGIVATLMVAFIIGAVISVALIAFQGKTMKSQVPFAPFLVSAAFVMVVLPHVFPELQILLYFLS